MLHTTAAQLLARTARAQRDGRAPSLVAGVVRGGTLAWSAGRGDVAEPHTDVQYRLGSITKTVTAVAVMRLRDEGLLDLDDVLEQHVPGTPFGRRTVGQLLSHMAGAGAESPGEWWERTPGTSLAGLGLSEADRPFAAGRRFHYSNLGFGVLGQLVAAVRNRPWSDVVRDEVLLPLGMTRTTPRPTSPAAQGFAVHPWADLLLPEPEHDAVSMAAAGQLWSTLADLGRFAAFLLGDTADVLTTATLEEMSEPSGAAVEGADWSAYGLGVMVVPSGDRTLLGHSGSMPGFLAGVFVDRLEQTGVVSLSNATSGGDRALLPDLLRIVRDAEPHVVDAWRPATSYDAQALALVGPWYWGPTPVSVTLRADGVLHLEGLGRKASASRFVSRGDGTWVGLDSYYAGEVLRPAADGLSFNLATFVFTRTPYAPADVIPGGVDERGWQ
ncbi:MAG: Penicillin-binding protein beta-lactamase class [Frankiales bacterium]|nr:Penicillin-binding protein beta-lactamase class [Frankiales bacterium]